MRKLFGEDCNLLKDYDFARKTAKNKDYYGSGGNGDEPDMKKVNAEPGRILYIQPFFCNKIKFIADNSPQFAPDQVRKYRNSRICLL